LELTIALDAMGGDCGPEAIVPAALYTLEKHKNLHLILVGQEETLTRVLAKHNTSANDRVRIHHASEIVEMYESPSMAMRNKRT